MSSIALWFRIIRPQTLFASLCPVLVGLIVTHMLIGPTGSLARLTAVLTAVSALALQVLSNLINDYYDYKRGTDKQGRVGFKRALAEGTVSEKAMLTACCVALIVAVASGAFLCYIGGWPIVAIGATSLLFAWLYTATPYSLSYLGIADIVCFLFYGPVATVGTAWLQTGRFSLTALLLGCVCGCVAVCVLATNNIRDIEDDRAVGKRTFPVRFGKNAARVGVALMLVGAEAFALLALKGCPSVWLMLVPFGVSVFLYVRLLKAQGAQYNLCLFRFGLLNACYVLAALAAVAL
jgi:1,4-dihydroxy-2-naphthoate octaprenyltransferase